MNNIFLIIFGGWIVYAMLKAIEYHNNNVLPPDEGYGCNEIKHCYYFIEGLKKYAVFDGYASRNEFWRFYLMVIVFNVASAIIDSKLFGVPWDEGTGPASLIIQIGLFIPSLSIGARRLHDIGKSGWWQLLYFTVVGIIVLIIWWATASENSRSYSSKRKVKRNSKEIHIFDRAFEYKDYVDRYLKLVAKDYQSLYKQKKILDLHKKQFGRSFDKNFKFKFEIESKYWGTECIHPRSEDEFVDHFLKDKNLHPLEGVWEEKDWGLIGIVKEKSFFQIYDLMITMKHYIPHLKKHSSAEFVDGSKGGAIFPTKNKKKFKGVGRVVFQTHYPGDVEDTGVCLQSVKTEFVLEDNYTLHGRFKGFDNRKTLCTKVWPPANYYSDNEDGNPDSIADELKKLNKLYKNNEISKSEFNKAKKKILK
jgi:uncharacterized membrane protein YhaH (DUF805 family)